MKVTMAVKDWVLKDATVDNTVAIASQDGDAATAAFGHGIRESGWEASRSHDRAGQGVVGWPRQLNTSGSVAVRCPCGMVIRES